MLQFLSARVNPLCSRRNSKRTTLPPEVAPSKSGQRTVGIARTVFSGANEHPASGFSGLEEVSGAKIEACGGISQGRADKLTYECGVDRVQITGNLVAVRIRACTPMFRLSGAMGLCPTRLT